MKQDKEIRNTEELTRLLNARGDAFGFLRRAWTYSGTDAYNLASALRGLEEEVLSKEYGDKTLHADEPDGGYLAPTIMSEDGLFIGKNIVSVKKGRLYARNALGKLEEVDTRTLCPTELLWLCEHMRGWRKGVAPKDINDKNELK